jgi:quinohemoprotein ethanol dehydrogenase
VGTDSRFTDDLRRSGSLQSEDAWRSVVIDGALKENGMLSFAKFLTRREAEDIRAYVLQQARKVSADNTAPKQKE